MGRVFCVAAALVVSIVVTPATAGRPDVVAAGSGPMAGACLTVIGASSHTTGTSWWSVSYWPQASAAGPAGTCPESEAHAEPRIECVQVVSRGDGGRELFLSGRARNGNTYYFRVADGGPTGSDAAGVALQASTDPSRCGAGDVPLTPVSQGGFTIASA